ncbi:MAG: G2/mitotic-specific cyclin [Phylliscum demangeonii]|nr:MAG: G2/mitotic-specific cyclin [Phylliscum demangeonii]
MRLTRAKAAALTTDATNGIATTAATKKPLQSKTTNANTNTNAHAAPAQRKRAALGDVSNVTKSETAMVKDTKKSNEVSNIANISKSETTMVKDSKKHTEVTNVTNINKSQTAMVKDSKNIEVTNITNINKSETAMVKDSKKNAEVTNITNFNKSETAAVNDSKKNTVGKAKVSLISKASQSTGVQKPSRTATTRSVLATKETNRKVTGGELKRPASGSGVMGGLPKKRNTTSTSHQRAIREEPEDDEEEVLVREAAPAAKKIITVEVDTLERERITVEEAAPTEQAHVVPGHGHVQTKEEIMAEGDDLDFIDCEDPLMVAEYAAEIFDYLHELELVTMPNPEYMEHQDDLEWKMRGILVDWLIEVHARFHLLPETLFLAVNIIDRFLSAKVVQLARLQLVGVTAMFIASKYEEVMSPHVSNFRHVADDGFSEQEILSAERYVLAALGYNLSYPNPMNFLRRISKADQYDIQTRTIGKYLMEISLVDDRFLAHPPSLIAATAMYLARLILDRGEWDPTLVRYSGYTVEEIEPIFHLMVDYLARPVAHEAFFKKYASKKFLKASILTRQWAKRFIAVDAVAPPPEQQHLAAGAR